MLMSKALREMPEQTGRASVACGEAVRDFASDEACDPRHETRDTGTAPKRQEVSPLFQQAHDLNFSKYEGTPHFPVTASSAKIGL